MKSGVETKKNKKANGEGTIYFDKKTQRWRGAVCVGYENGVMKRKYFTAYNEKDVQKQIDKFIENRNKIQKYDNLNITGELTLKVLLNMYLENKRYKLSPVTYDSYENIINKHIIPYIGDAEISDISFRDIKDYFNQAEKRRASADIMRKARTILRDIFNSSYEDGYIEQNVMMQKIKIYSNNAIVNNTQRYLEESEIRMFLDAIRGDSLESLFITQLFTGLRISEVLALTWDKIDFNKKSINVSAALIGYKNRDNDGTIVKKGLKNYKEISKKLKTINSRRDVPLCEIVEKALLKHIEKQEELREKFIKKNGKEAAFNPNNLVFCSMNGNLLNQSNIRRSLKRLTENIEIKISGTHALRHSFASLLNKKGLNIKEISKTLGHADTAFTMKTYIHPTEDRIDECNRVINEFTKNIEI